MKIGNERDVPKNDVLLKDAKGVKIQWLISGDDGAPNFAMRRFTIIPGGHTPYHSHAHEHEVFIIAGKGKAVYKNRSIEVIPGSFVFIDGGSMHNFVNDGDEDLIFLCMVPNING
ncbi:cupin domain-containing protein [bacterium]|nr:cupin domain-containing protein [bacterium]